ncbi:MAG TPA: VIT domain-containing protein [Kofleriaceae bacterium]|nr:VIT domain-containing protein [Kofleriaceae bacterium]
MTSPGVGLMTDDEIAGLGTWPDAGFGVLDSPHGALPLAAMDVDARVVGVVAAIDVAQTFVNTTGAAIEATYIFPLPDRAAVHRFQMVVAGRVIEGVIDERGAARETYDRAIAAGHRAAITEEDRAGVFSLRVGNLLPGESATVRIALVAMLAVDDGEVTLRFPLVVAPRYVPGHKLGGEQAGPGTAFDTDLVPDASRISPPVRLPGVANPVRLGLRVALADGVMRDVVSSLHAVTERKQDAQVIEVRPGERLDRDFIVRWRLDGGGGLASSLVCCDDADGRAGTFALTVVPPSTRAVAAKPRDVVFVLDRSGSMEGWKMVAARRAVARMIDSLTSRDRFAAIAFDDRVEAIPGEHLVDATDRLRFRAVEAIAKVDARGSTEIARPLQLALGMLLGGTGDRERMIVLVTDGQVGNEDHILRELGGALRNVKMFTLGIDQAVNAAFLRRLAELGGGLCELVESEDRLDQVMTKVHQRIATPIATELAVGAAAGFELDRASLPAKLPDVYAGAPVVILGRYRGKHAAGAAISVEGTSLGDPLHERVVASALPSAPLGGASWLAACWARTRIRALEDQYAVRANGALEEMIVQTSKQFGVLSRFTAFLAVDRSEVANPGGRVREIVQPVETPAGWGAAAPAPAAVAYMPQAAMPRGATATVMGPSMLERSLPFSGAKYGGPPADRAPSGAGGFGAADDALGGPGAGDDEVALDAWAELPPSAPARSAPLRSRAPVPPVRVAEARFRQPGEEMILRPAAPPFAAAASSASHASPASPAEPADAAFRRAVREIAELLADAARRQDATALRVLRQRLTQWVDDVRAAGHGALADAAAVPLAAVNAALAAVPLDLEALAGAARALEQIADATQAPTPPTPTPPEPPAKRSWKFWK